jgi:cytochrome c oxidase assembly protein subunit 15
MSGRVIPEAMWALDPFWRNFFENEATTQFFHRLTAYALFAAALFAGWKYRKDGPTYFPLFAALVTGQALLGVVTLVHAAPLTLALLHQALGVVVLIAATRLLWTARQ